MAEEKSIGSVISQDDVQSLTVKVAKMEQLIDELRRDLSAQRGDGGMAFMNGDLDMGGNQIINMGRSGTSDMAVARDELIDLVFDNVIFREDITSTGTAHALANTPYDSTKVLLVLNGSLMEIDGTGYEGFTITAAGSITTVTSIEAADEFYAMYVRTSG